MVDSRSDRPRALAFLSHERPAVALTAAATAVLTLVATVQGYFARRAQSEPITVWQSATLSAASWAVWAVFAPGILWLGRHADFRRGRRLLSVLVHFSAFLVCHVASFAGLAWLGAVQFSPTATIPIRELILFAFTGTRLPLSAILYAAILGLGYAVRLQRTLREREVQTSRLEAQAARARLEALASRLQPHFLFNTLHAIGVLAEENPREARAMITELGDLLRDVLADSDGTDVSLREELALLDRYLQIERRRFADRLDVKVSAAADVLDVKVPRLLLQPLVENAIRHGLATRAAGRVRIEAEREGEWLRVRVWNDGAPLPKVRQEGVGLTTTRERLRTRYRRSEFALSDADGGVEALLKVPLSPEPIAG